MKRCCCAFTAAIFGVFVFFAVARAAPPGNAGSPARHSQHWLKTPTLSIMTGFIYEPLKP